MSAPTFPGCLIAVRPVAVLRMSDEEGQSDKLVCVPTDDPSWDEIKDLDDMPAQLRTEIQHFYSMYKQPEGKEVESRAGTTARPPREAIDEARKAYQEAQP